MNTPSQSPLTASQPATPTDPIQLLLDRPITSAELDAGAAQAALPVDLRSSQSVRYLLFQIGEEIAALPAMTLRRVTPTARVIPIPHRSTPVLRGMCNIRGELVLCANLHRLLGLPSRDEAAEAAETSRMVIIGPAENSWAFEVDALRGIENADPHTFRKPPVTVGRSIADFTLGVTEFGEISVTVLDGDRILAGFKAALA